MYLYASVQRGINTSNFPISLALRRQLLALGDVAAAFLHGGKLFKSLTGTSSSPLADVTTSVCPVHLSLSRRRNMTRNINVPHISGSENQGSIWNSAESG